MADSRSAARPRNRDGTVTQIRGSRVTCSCGKTFGPFPMGRSIDTFTVRARDDHRAEHGGLAKVKR